MGHVILLCALNSLQSFGGKSSFYLKFCPLHRAQVKLHKAPPPWDHTSSRACHIQTDPLVSPWNTFLGPNSHALTLLCGWIFISGSSHKPHASFPHTGLSRYWASSDLSESRGKFSLGCRAAITFITKVIKTECMFLHFHSMSTAIQSTGCQNNFTIQASCSIHICT